MDTLNSWLNKAGLTQKRQYFSAETRKRIKELFKISGMSQRDFCEEYNITRSIVRDK